MKETLDLTPPSPAQEREKIIQSRKSVHRFVMQERDLKNISLSLWEKGEGRGEGFHPTD